MENDKLAKLKETIKDCAYNEEQMQEAFNYLNTVEPKINKVISTFVYNKEWGKEISVLTSPSLDIKFEFKKN